MVKTLLPSFLPPHDTIRVVDKCSKGLMHLGLTSGGPKRGDFLCKLISDTQCENVIVSFYNVVQNVHGAKKSK